MRFESDKLMIVFPELYTAALSRAKGASLYDVHRILRFFLTSSPLFVRKFGAFLPPPSCAGVIYGSPLSPPAPFDKFDYRLGWGKSWNARSLDGEGEREKGS